MARFWLIHWMCYVRIVGMIYWLIDHRRRLMKYNRWLLINHRCPVDNYRWLVVHNGRSVDYYVRSVYYNIWLVIDLRGWVINQRWSCNDNFILSLTFSLLAFLLDRCFALSLLFTFGTTFHVCGTF